MKAPPITRGFFTCRRTGGGEKKEARPSCWKKRCCNIKKLPAPPLHTSHCLSLSTFCPSPHYFCCVLDGVSCRPAQPCTRHISPLGSSCQLPNYIRGFDMQSRLALRRPSATYLRLPSKSASLRGDCQAPLLDLYIPASLAACSFTEQSACNSLARHGHSRRPRLTPPRPPPSVQTQLPSRRARLGLHLSARC